MNNAVNPFYGFQIDQTPIYLVKEPVLQNNFFLDYPNAVVVILKPITAPEFIAIKAKSIIVLADLNTTSLTLTADKTIVAMLYTFKSQVVQNSGQTAYFYDDISNERKAIADALRQRQVAETWQIICGLIGTIIASKSEIVEEELGVVRIPTPPLN